MTSACKLPMHTAEAMAQTAVNGGPTTRKLPHGTMPFATASRAHCLDFWSKQARALRNNFLAHAFKLESRLVKHNLLLAAVDGLRAKACWSDLAMLLLAS